MAWTTRSHDRTGSLADQLAGRTISLQVPPARCASASPAVSISPGTRRSSTRPKPRARSMASAVWRPRFSNTRVIGWS